MAKSVRKPKIINLYGFGGLLLALNFAILPPSFDIDSRIRAIISPSIQIVAEKTEKPESILIEAPADKKSSAGKSFGQDAAGEPKRVIYVMVTAYSSTPDQTDDTPFITASGKHVHDGTIAANFLKFGTKIKIPELFGDKVFVVEDGMGCRYFHRVDIWFPDRSMALKFGKREAEIVIVES